MKSKSSAQSVREMSVLGESFDALKGQFNDDTSKPRLVALFSPT